MSELQSVTEKDSAETEQHSVEPETYPPELVERNQWMNWFYGDDNRKIPVSYNTKTTGKDRFKPNVCENWRDFEDALWWAENRDVDGLTFVLSEEDPFLVIDGDDVRDPETGEIHPGFLRAIDRAQSYADVSVSGTGIHLILHEGLPDKIDKIDSALPEHENFPGASVEVYDQNQHITMSGDHLAITPTEVRCNLELIDDIVDEYGPKATEQKESTESTSDDERAPVEAEEYDEGDKPDEWPSCYYKALRARERPPAGANRWQIDSLTGQLGLWAGFTVNEVTEHFERYCPVGKWDEAITRKSLENLKDKVESYQYPPGTSKLYHAGILSEPFCDCEIHGESTGTYNPRGPSIRLLKPEDRQTVSGSGIIAVSKALEALHVASAKEISEWTGYSPKQTYRILHNNDWRRKFGSIEVNGTTYWYGAVTPVGLTDERLSELPMSLSEYVQVFAAGRERVDTDGKARMLDALCENGPMTVREASEWTDYSLSQARRTLSELTDTGFSEKRARYGATMEYAVNPQLVESA